jgi:hypothetical protein
MSATPDLAKAVNLVSEELERVLHSHAFAGSERSCSLLRYLVEHALGGGQHALKERIIGMELFGRDASYDTGKDAIVRVSASSVRKRLLAHYASADAAHAPGALRIHLPPGSYTPEFHALPSRQEATSPGEATVDAALTSVSAAPVGWPRWPAPAWTVIGVLVLACFLLVWHNRQLSGRVPPAPGMEFVPWSHFGPRMSVRVVLTDINYAIYTHIVVKRLLSLEEYLGDQWTGDFDSRMAATSPRSGNQYTSVVSAVAASRVSAMLMTTGRSALLVYPRKMHMDDFKGEQVVILLGSSITDPWAELFRDSLTFAINTDPVTRYQYIENHSPLRGEPTRWDPTSAAASPGTSYAILSLLPNLTGKGWVLLVAGTNAEGTGAASELLTDPARLREELLHRGINPVGRVQKLELLLRVQYQGMDSRSYQVIASRVVAR